MYRHFLSFTKAAAFFIVLALAGSAEGVYELGSRENTTSAGKKAVILYARADAANLQAVKNTYTLLRSYCPVVEMDALDEYKKGVLEDAQYVLIMAGESVGSHRELALDLEQFKGKIIWVGNGIEGYGIAKDFKKAEYAGGIFEVSYAFGGASSSEERIFTGKIENAACMEVTGTENAKAYGSMKAGSGIYPYAVESGRVWFISFPAIEGELGEVYADILGKIFAGNGDEGEVYIRLEGISVFTELKKLEEAGAWFESQGIPFIMQLRPVFRNAGMDYMETYSEVLRKMQKEGGTAVLENLPGWEPDDPWNQELRGHIPAGRYGEETPGSLISASIKAYSEHGVYPVAFACSPDLFFSPGYSTVLKDFSTVVQSGSWAGYPSGIERGQEWKGLYIMEHPFSKAAGEPGDLFLKTGAISYTLGFDIEAPLEEIKEAVVALRERGVQLGDLRKRDGRVDFQGNRLMAGNGELYLNGERLVPYIKKYSGETAESTPEPLPEGQSGRLNTRVKQTMEFVLIIVSAFIFIFVAAFIGGKIIDRRKHLR